MRHLILTYRAGWKRKGKQLNCKFIVQSGFHLLSFKKLIFFQGLSKPGLLHPIFFNVFSQVSILSGLDQVKWFCARSTIRDGHHFRELEMGIVS